IARGTKGDVGTSTSSQGSCQAFADLTVEYSNFGTTDSSFGGTVTEGSGNQKSAAQTDEAAIFAGPSTYRQREGAPTYNAGVNGSDDSDFVDLDGDPRRGDGMVDIGADELPSAPVVTTGMAT